MQIQSNGDNLDREVNTEDITTNDVFQQFPEDVGINYWKLKKTANYLGDVKEEELDFKSERAAINLNNFMQNATPVMEAVLEENIEMANLDKPKAKEKSPFELTGEMKFYKEILNEYEA